MKILIVLRDRTAWRRVLKVLPRVPSAELFLAPLCEDQVLFEEAREDLGHAGFDSIHVLTCKADFRQICLRARDRLLSFTSRWPERFRFRGRSFRELFVHRKKLSWWWLAELSQRNADDRPAYGWFFELELLRTYLAMDTYELAAVCVDQVDFYDTICSFLHHRGCRCLENRGRRPLLDGNRTSLLWLLRWRDFFGELSHQLIVRWHFRRRLSTARVSSGLPGVYWHSWYPLEWLTVEGKHRDRYYLDLPDAADATGKFRSCYVATIRGPRWPKAVGRAVRQLLSEIPPARLDLVQRYGRIRDLLRCYLDLWSPLFYWALETFSPRYRESFFHEDVDLFPIFRDELRISYLRLIPRWLATAEQFRRFAAVHRPGIFVTYLKFYCYGRAVIYGVKSGSPATEVIGYQHSAITPMKLVYNYSPGELRHVNGAGEHAFIDRMPLPDHFTAHGTMAKEILCAGGYSEARVHITGIVRIDHLYRLMQQPAEPAPEISGGRKVVLVATPIWPDRTRKLVEIAIRGIGNRDDVCTIFKLHPNYPKAEECIHATARRHKFRNYRLENSELYRLIRFSSVMFTTSSTSGAEAIAMGIPVIHLQTTREIDLSPFFAIPDAALEVSNVEEFCEALDVVLNGKEKLRACQLKWPELLRNTFYAVDGKTGERFLEVLAKRVYT